jgi:hypothetical protein
VRWEGGLLLPSYLSRVRARAWGGIGTPPPNSPIPPKITNGERFPAPSVNRYSSSSPPKEPAPVPGPALDRSYRHSSTRQVVRCARCGAPLYVVSTGPESDGTRLCRSARTRGSSQSMTDTRAKSAPRSE